MPNACYGGTHEFLDTFGPRLGLEVTYVDGCDIDAYEAAIRPNTAVLYAETSTNPTMRVTDMGALGQLSRKAGKLLMVDNTFLSPYHCTPLADVEGVDVVLHSCTKYLGGHSDVTAGCVATTDSDFAHTLTRVQRLYGGVLPAMDSYLLLRGIKTLDVRMERHAASALRVARWLEAHPAVERVFYPGLESHPDHDIATAQWRRGYSAMLAVEVKGGADAGRQVCEALRVVHLAVSLGSVESLIEHPATMTHTMVTREEREEAGITDGLLRLSIGLEDAQDIIDDFDRAFAGLA
mmetsp:Transcript_155203/g.376953  ORF Transcript_155203/g.376953 Transcript_155203/m.376953 type:complete len:293 (-) Transcript_155203:1132-2010(-)